MIKLSHENFIKARDYIFAHSDNINRAWFRYNFMEIYGIANSGKYYEEVWIPVLKK